MTSKIHFVAIMLRMVTIIPKMTDKTIELPTALRSPISSFEPKRCETITEKPLAKPRIKPKTKKVMPPVAPTAASAWTPINCPTTTVSTIA